MEPSELYNRNKRNLIILAGLLLLLIFGGINPDENTTFLWFKLREPAAVPVAIWLIVIYSLYQYFLGWSMQTDAVRSKLFYDYILSLILSIASILGAAAVYLYPVSTQIGLLQWIVLIVVLVVVAVAVVIIFRASNFTIWKREAINLRKRTIAKRLEETGWVLMFNREFKRSKPIAFLPGDEIGEGRNENEHTWRLDGETLIIKRMNGSIQNRFAYNDTMDQFDSTDDADAHAVRSGYKGQSIYRQNVA